MLTTSTHLEQGHVFSDKSSLCRHMNDVFCEDLAISADKRRNSYLDNNGHRHFCFVIRDRDDVGLFLAYTFVKTHVHGDFSHLSPDDEKFMRDMLVQRTRQPNP